MTPYIVTTTEIGPQGHDPIASRRAVATLDEAREGALTEIELGGHGVADFELLKRADTLPESGGTVGPLPDGTLIEVERVEYRALCDCIGEEPLKAKLDGWTAPELVDAFNARQS